jgi:membrane-associated phospholipid phosphatase
MKPWILALSFLLCARAALADPAAPPRASGTGVDLWYAIDGGAVPFFWVPVAGLVALDLWATPRATPLFFSETEGGASEASWEVPGYAVTGVGVATGLAMALGGDGARWDHVKGLAEAVATSSLVTGVLKVSIGRHRPDWSVDNDDPAEHRSFPSGHSSEGFAIASYAILYLRGHVFEARRGDAVLPWWELATYAGIGLGAVAIAGERVVHHRHHVSDVVAGGLLGTASSTLFYLYQDRRSRDRHAMRVTPSVTPTGATVGVSLVW